MPSARSRPCPRSRQHHTHHWTTFEQHALLCLICRQIPITGLPGTPNPSTTSTPVLKPTLSHTRIRGGKRKKTPATAKVTEFSRSIRHAHRDVADALNRALNFANQERDIPVEEVSTMIEQLMEERKGAVKYLERQRTSRVTRSMRRVWERAGMMSCRGGGDGGGGTIGGDSLVGTAADYGGDQILDSTDVGGEDDPWGDGAATSLVETQPDPWGEEVAAYLNEIQQDPWGDDEAIETTMECQEAAEVRSSVQADTTTIDAENELDPWGSHTAPTKDSDPADPWGDIVTPSTANNNHSEDPWTDPSSQFESPSNPDLTSSQAPQLIASASTYPKTVREQEFTGINSDRLAMIESNAEFHDGETVNEQVYVGRGKGGNAIELPFNRMEATTNGRKDIETADETALDAVNDESDVSEEV